MLLQAKPMIRATVLFAAALALLTATAQAEPCKTSGHAEAKEVALNLGNARTRNGLHISFQLGLLPIEFPFEDIRANKSPCTRGTFAVFSHTFELFGEDENLPPRWAVSPSAKEVMTLYLAMMPKPDVAADWYEKTRPKGPAEVTFKDDEYMWALVATHIAEQPTGVRVLRSDSGR
jgi:hypothetical protein